MTLYPASMELTQPPQDSDSGEEAGLPTQSSWCPILPIQIQNNEFK